jgi:hypothetical protein
MPSNDVVAFEQHNAVSSKFAEKADRYFLENPSQKASFHEKEQLDKNRSFSVRN